MKRLCSKVMLIAAAAIAFLACQKSEIEAPKFVEVNGLSFSSEKPVFDAETKTEWTGNTIQWSIGDKIRVAYTCDGVWQNADGTSKSSEESGSKTAKIYESKAITEAGSTASFSVPGYFKGTAEGVYVFYGIYPSSLVSGADIKYAPSVTINIPAEQTPSASSFDSKADVMASKSDSYVGIPKDGEDNGTVSLKWERLSAHGHFTLKNLAVVGEENIQSITLTANADADMVGTHYLYLDTYNVVKPKSNDAPNVLSIDAKNLSIDADGNVTFWACFLPCTWTSLKVEVETDKATYTRDIDLSSNQKTFVKNARNVLGIKMASAQREVKSANPLPFIKDFSECENNSTAIDKLDGFTVEGSVYTADGAIRLAKGEAGGSITTQLLDLSQDFYVKVTASGWDSDELVLSVSAGEQSENIELTAGNGSEGPGECIEHIINFSPVSNSSSVIFEAAKGKRCYIKAIEICEGHAVADPVLKATNPSIIAAEGGEYSFNYTLLNPLEGVDLTAEETVSWITDVAVDVENNKVTYKVAENTTEESREGVITLTYEGVDPVNVTIYQAAAEQTGGGEGGDSEVKAWTLVTSVSELAIGDEIIIAAKDYNYAMSITQNTNNRGQEAIEKDGNILKTPSNNVQILILASGTKTGTFAFYTGSKYLYAASSTGNNMKEQSTLNDNGSWKITIASNGAASVVAQGSNTRNTMRYNNSSSLFSSYDAANSMKDIVIYKQMPYSGEGGGTTPEPDPEPDEGGESVTVSNTIAQIADSNGWVNGTKYGSFSLDDIITATVAGGGNSGKFYTDGNQWRIYQTETPKLTITAAEGYTIETVKITYNYSKTGVLTLGTSNIASKTTVSVNAASVEFGVGNTESATDGQVRVTQIEVVYHADN